MAGRQLGKQKDGCWDRRIPYIVASRHCVGELLVVFCSIRGGSLLWVVLGFCNGGLAGDVAFIGIIISVLNEVTDALVLVVQCTGVFWWGVGDGFMLPAPSRWLPLEWLFSSLPTLEPQKEKRKLFAMVSLINRHRDVKTKSQRQK